jgi:hypothetical protein
MSRVIVFAVTLACILASAGVQAGIVIPGGLHPGDHYYLAFVTDGAQDATSSNIADYNQFVQAQAALDPALTGTNLGIQWHAIASTASTSAINNLALLPATPVYLLDGTTQVSVTDSTGWLGASVLHAIDFDQFAVDVSSGGRSFAWTGTNSAGTGSLGAAALGGTAPELGAISGYVDFHWVAFGQASPSQSLPLYAVSSTLTVVHGDVNFDGIVNGLDISLVASHWLQTGVAVPGDANGDDIVNGLDISLIASNWLQSAASGASGGGRAVPEPSTILLAASGGLVLFRSRRFKGRAAKRKPTT